MRDVARTTGDDPEPEPAALAELAAAEYRERLALYARMTDLIQAAPGPRTAAMWREAGMLLIDSGHHCEELRASLDTLAAVDALAERFYAAGWEDREAAYRRETARAPRTARGGHRRRVPGQGTLWPVGGIAAAVAWLKHSRPAVWAAHHVAASVTAAVSGTAVVATGSALFANAVLAPSSPAQAFGGVPAPAASAYAAVPFAGWSPAPPARGVKAQPDVKSWHTAAIAPGSVPPYWSPSSSSAPSSAQPSQAPSSSQPQPPGGPAQLLVSDTTVDLTSGAPVIITVSAGGSGWASWSVNAVNPATGTNPDDLDFSPDHGVLQAGQSVKVTVSVDANQAVTGDASETFEIVDSQGAVIQQVTATLPAPVAAQPSPAVTGTDGATDVPTPDPSSS